jgi:hypothetical protein
MEVGKILISLLFKQKGIPHGLSLLLLLLLLLQLSVKKFILLILQSLLLFLPLLLLFLLLVFHLPLHFKCWELLYLPTLRREQPSSNRQQKRLAVSLSLQDHFCFSLSFSSLDSPSLLVFCISFIPLESLLPY